MKMFVSHMLSYLDIETSAERIIAVWHPEVTINGKDRYFVLVH